MKTYFILLFDYEIKTCSKAFVYNYNPKIHFNNKFNVLNNSLETNKINY